MKKFLQKKLDKFRKKRDASTTAVSTKVKGKKKKKITKKRVVIAIIILGIAVFAGYKLLGPDEGIEVVSQGFEDVVSRQDIEVTVSSTATLKPADKYSITSAVKGTVLECTFEKGDIVNEGDILYKIDASDMENTIKRAEISYNKVYKSYLETMKLLEDLNVKADDAGTITKMYVKVGDEVSAGSKIADVRNSDIMTLTIPFNSSDAKNINIGDKGIVTLNNTFEKLECVVTDVDGADTVLSGNRIVRYVEVEVQNPGAITNTTEGTVVINSMACSASGKFEYSDEFTVIAKVNGTIDKLNVAQGSKIEKNQVIAVIESESVLDQVESSQMSLDDAKLAYDNTLEQIEDYTIKAPITGTIITKNTKAGDSLDTTNGQNTLAEIYDMSYLTFDISVDELDINKLHVGQSVRVTSDSVIGVFEGIVTNVSIAGTTQGGVTTYPVTVEIDNPPEDLLPGMNINAEIVLQQVQDVLAVPVSAVQRGNLVYIKDESVTTKEDEYSIIPAGYRAVEVETGFSNNSYIEIVSGLSEGDIIYVPNATGGNNWGGGDMIMYEGGMGGGAVNARPMHGGGF